MNHSPGNSAGNGEQQRADPDSSMRSVLRGLAVLKGSLTDPEFDTFPDTPQDAFKIWLYEAIEESVKEPHAMTLSTVDDQGWPDARVLILKDVDNRGWHFSVKSGSPKGLQIASNNRVALTFYWPEVGRQIRLRGIATRLSDAECEDDFNARPAASKISALASKQSKPMTDRKELDAALEQARIAFENKPDERAIGWSVYAVQPDFIEFWQGSSDRLHHRLEYSRGIQGDDWTKQLLWP